MHALFRGLVLSVLAVAAPVWGGELEALKGHVADFGSVFTDQEKANLNGMLKTYDEVKGMLIVLVTAKTLLNVSPERMAETLAKSWSLDERNRRSVLVLVSMDDGAIHVSLGDDAPHSPEVLEKIADLSVTLHRLLGHDSARAIVGYLREVIRALEGFPSALLGATVA